MRYSSRNRPTIGGAVALSVLSIVSGQAIGADLPVVGLVEKVRLHPGGLVVHAKIDTGADVTSLNANNLKIRKRDGKTFVRFSVTNRDGLSQNFERRIRRTARIKRHEAKSIRRPVVVMGLCFGKLYREVEVNLAQRSKFKFQMLIGRNYLAGNMLVDASKTYTVEPKCSKVGWK